MSLGYGTAMEMLILQKHAVTMIAVMIHVEKIKNIAMMFLRANCIPFATERIQAFGILCKEDCVKRLPTRIIQR